MMNYFLVFTIIFFSINPNPKQRVFLIGDSTMANKKQVDLPETGWGQVFQEYFTETVEIHNHAVNGRSTKSFRDRGHWEGVYSQLEKNDYVIIQFGHNDSKTDDTTRYAPARTDYKNNLIRYIDEIRSKGATPMLATPVYRRKFDNEGKLVDAHGEYPQVVREVAALKKVELLDLHKLSGEFIQEQGESLSQLMFMHVNKNTYPKFPEGITDNTHFTYYGARCIAALAAEELMNIKNPLRNFLKKSAFSGKYEYELPNIATVAFPKDTFDIVRYGAKNSIDFLNTNAIQSAIDNANALGGGVVKIPQGLWITGPVVLKSNVNLYLEEGALLQFSDNRDHYPIVMTTWEGQVAYRCQAPVSARECTNIAITGKGTMDGAGQVWKSVKRNKLTDAQWKALINSGGVNDGKTWYPSESSKIGHETDWAKKITEGKTVEDYVLVKDFLRPNFISLISCNLVLIDGPTFNNSPAWTLHPLMCNHITVKNSRVINPWYGQNNDAIDLESCQYGLLDNCYFDSGDDAITLKSGRDEEGRKRGIPTAHLIIKNTTVIHGHGGFVVGSEMSGGVHDIFVDNCTFTGTDIGLRFKTTRGRGGTVRDIYISNIQMSKIVGEAILFSMYYAAKDPIPLSDDDTPVIESIEEPFTEATPVFRDVYMDKIYCKGASAAIRIDGLPESNVKNIRLSNASMETEQGMLINEGSDILFSQVEIKHKTGHLIHMVNGKNILFTNVKGLNPALSSVKVSGTKTKNIRFESMSWLKKPNIKTDTGVKSGEIKFK